MPVRLNFIATPFCSRTAARRCHAGASTGRHAKVRVNVHAVTRLDRTGRWVWFDGPYCCTRQHRIVLNPMIARVPVYVST